MFAPPSPFLRPLLTLLLVLALASLPFGHRTTATAQDDPALIAFVEAGGTLADICDGPGEGLHAALDCEACRNMAGGVLASPVSLLISATLGVPAHPDFPTVRPLPRGPAGFPPPPRAPPQV